MKLFRISLPVQLLFVIIFSFIFGSVLPEPIIRFLFTISALFKDILVLLLPFIIITFVLGGILELKRGAPIILGVMLLMIFCSNALVSLLTYGVINLVFPFITTTTANTTLEINELIFPYFNLSLPALLKSEHALIGAIILGLIFSYYRHKKIESFVLKSKELIEKILEYFVIPILPVYVFGFLVKMRYEGMFLILIQNYSTVFFLIIAMQIAYLTWFYFLANNFHWKQTVHTIKNALPSYLTAFSTMSSAITVPVSVKSAVQNGVSRPLALVAMPIMANVHLLGDSIQVPTLALMTLWLFTSSIPGVFSYLIFIFYFCTAMFAVSGVPAGTILVMTPILVTQLGFTDEMIGIITTLYVLMDAFGTAANVMGDGALAIMLNKTLKRIGIIE